MCFQTGLVHTGEESLFIQPVSVSGAADSFSGLEHKLVRHRRSTQTAISDSVFASDSDFPAAASVASGPSDHQAEYCEIIQGKSEVDRSPLSNQACAMWSLSTQSPSVLSETEPAVYTQ